MFVLLFGLLAVSSGLPLEDEPLVDVAVQRDWRDRFEAAEVCDVTLFRRRKGLREGSYVCCRSRKRHEGDEDYLPYVNIGVCPSSDVVAVIGRNKTVTVEESKSDPSATDDNPGLDEGECHVYRAWYKFVTRNNEVRTPSGCLPGNMIKTAMVIQDKLGSDNEHHIWASRDTKHHIWASRDTKHHIWASRDTKLNRVLHVRVQCRGGAISSSMFVLLFGLLAVSSGLPLEDEPLVKVAERDSDWRDRFEAAEVCDVTLFRRRKGLREGSYVCCRSRKRHEGDEDYLPYINIGVCPSSDVVAVIGRNKTVTVEESKSDPSATDDNPGLGKNYIMLSLIRIRPISSNSISTTGCPTVFASPLILYITCPLQHASLFFDFPISFNPEIMNTIYGHHVIHNTIYGHHVTWVYARWRRRGEMQPLTVLL
eukprot:sb/3464984/